MFTASRLSANTPIVNAGFEFGKAEGDSSTQHNSHNETL